MYVHVREFVDDDLPGIQQLVDEQSDALWVRQGHTLHGPANDGARWRRTLVAEVAGRVVGAVTLARNRVHPGRIMAAVEVAAHDRRRGIATQLIAAARQLPPAALPFAGKVRPDDADAMGLVRRLHGRVYQRCPGLCPDPSAADVVEWAARRPHLPGISIRPLESLGRTEWVRLWVEQYLWVHADWSPAAVGPLHDVAVDLVDEADPRLSVVTLAAGGDVTSVTWVFPEEHRTVSIVSETSRRVVPDGVEHVAAGLAACFQRLREQSISRAELDGHVGDPHLGPVLASFPGVRAEPVLLVEVDAAS